MTLTTWRVFFRAVLLTHVLMAAAPASADIKPEPLALEAGRATVKGALKGDDTIDYRFSGAQGAGVAISMQTTNGANYFNLLREGADQALFIGNIDGISFEGKLPETGAYIIRVYLMRSAARRNEKADYTLSVAVSESAVQEGSLPNFAEGLNAGPDSWEVATTASAADRVLRGAPASGARGIVNLQPGAKLINLGCRLEGGVTWCEVRQDEDSKLRGWVIGAALVEAKNEVAVPLPTKFDASAELKCSSGTPPSLGLPPLDKTCEVRVVRRTGEVELWILKPGTIDQGRFLSFAPTTFKSDDNSEVTWLRSDDNWLVGINGSEFYFFPDALLTGG